MKQANFKNVKVGQRFVGPDGKHYVKIRPCYEVTYNGTTETRNAVMIGGAYATFGNAAVSILEDDEV